VVNKSDREGARRLKAELEYVLQMGEGEHQPPVLLTAANTGDGIEELYAGVRSRADEMARDGSLNERRTRRLEIELRKILSAKVHALLDEQLETESRIRQWARELFHGETTPYRLINGKIEEFKESLV
jgi:LAO/AO transport system kinase